MPLYLEDISKNVPRYKTTNYAILYKNRNDLFKIFRDYEYANLEIIEYLHNLYDFVKKNNILPKDLIYYSDVIYGDVICGYKEEFINGYTFLEALKKPVLFERKVQAINHISLALQDINQYIIVGDINLQNLLISKEKNDKNGYIIDFDFSKKRNEDYITLAAYYVKINNNRITDNLNTDKVKIFISFLSLLYGYNFEEIVGSYKCTDTLEVILEKLENLKNNGILFEYANYLKNQFDKNLPVDEYFFIPENYSIEKEIEVGRNKIRQRKKQTD